jgi:hypothetical protein
MEKAWYEAWKDLLQEQIQKWITAIPYHIQKIIRCQGGNEYKEGREGFKRSFAGRRIKRKLSTHQFVKAETQHQASVEDNSDSEEEDDKDGNESEKELE